jgi:hypothetical protein
VQPKPVKGDLVLVNYYLSESSILGRELLKGSIYQSTLHQVDPIGNVMETYPRDSVKAHHIGMIPFSVMKVQTTTREG